MKKSLLKSVGGGAGFIGIQCIVGAILLFFEFWRHPDLIYTLYVDNPFGIMFSPVILKVSIFTCIIADVILAVLIIFKSIRSGDINRFVRGVSFETVMLLAGFTSLCWVGFNTAEMLLPKSTFYTSISDAIYNYSPALFILYAGLIAPIVEELLCRFFIIESFSEDKKGIAIVVSAVIFGALHGNLQQGIPATLIGVILGLLYVKSRNIVIPIIFHLIFNNLSILTMLTEDFKSTVVLALFLCVITAVGYQSNFKCLFEQDEEIELENFCVFRDAGVKECCIFEEVELEEFCVFKDVEPEEFCIFRDVVE